MIIYIIVQEVETRVFANVELIKCLEIFIHSLDVLHGLILSHHAIVASDSVFSHFIVSELVAVVGLNRRDVHLSHPRVYQNFLDHVLATPA